MPAKSNGFLHFAIFGFLLTFLFYVAAAQAAPQSVVGW